MFQISEKDPLTLPLTLETYNPNSRAISEVFFYIYNYTKSLALPELFTWKLLEVGL